MSTEINNQIVEMRFDNAQFERETKTTMKTLDRLKEKLKFKGADEGLENVRKSANQVKFDNMANGIDNISNKFTLMGRIGLNILDSIADKIVDVGRKAVDMLAVDPLRSGFSEYELKMNSMKTIMANMNQDAADALTQAEIDVAKKVLQGKYGNGKARQQALEAMGYDYTKIQNALNGVIAANGYSADAFYNLDTSVTTTQADVNNLLNELNKYADDTVYNFAQMTDAIGRFTTAGVDVRDATVAVKGLANLAAVAGTDNTQLARTYIQVAQALNTGTMMLQDWRSLENANIATVQFQEVIKETAREHGMAVDEMIADQGSFRLSLSQGWLTNEILLESLRKYTDEETELGQKAYAAAQNVRTFTIMVDQIKESLGSGWTNTWEIVIGNMDEATEMWTRLTNAITGIIDPIGNARNQILTYWKTAGGRDNIIETLFESAENFSYIFKPFKKLITDFFSNHSVSLWLVDVTQKWRDFTDSINSRLRIFDTQGGTNALADGIKNLFNAVRSFINPIKQAFNEIFNLDGLKLYDSRLIGAAQTFRDFTASLALNEKQQLGIKKVASAVFKTLKNVSKIVKPIIGVFGLLAKAASTVASKILEFFSNLNQSDKTFKDTVIYKILTTLFEVLTAAVLLAANAIANFYTRIKNSGTLTKIQNQLSKLWETIKPFGTFVADKFVEAIDRIASKEIKMPNAYHMATSISKADEKWSSLTSGIKEAKKKFDNFFNSLFKFNGTDKTFADNLKEKINNIFNDPRGALITAKTNIENFVSSIGNTLSKFFHWILDSGVTDVIAVGLGIYSLYELGTLLKNLKNGTIGLGGVFKSIKGFFDGLKNIAVSFAKDALFVYIVTQIAKSMVLLASSLAVLANVDTAKLVVATACLGIIMLAFKGLLKTVAGMVKISTEGAKLSKLGDVKVNTSMVGLGLMVIGFAIALKSLYDIWKKMGDTITSSGDPLGTFVGTAIVITVFLAAIVGSMALIIKASKGITATGKQFAGIGVMIAAASLAFLPLTTALEKVFTLSVMSPKDLYRSAGILIAFSAALVLMLGAIAFISNKINSVSSSGGLWKQIKNNGKFVLSVFALSTLALNLAAATNLIAMAMAKIGKIPKQQYERGLKAMAVIFGGMALVTVAGGAIGKLTGIGFALLAMVAPIAACIALFPSLTENFNDFFTMLESHTSTLIWIGAITAAIIAVSVAIAALTKDASSKFNKFATGVLKLSGAFLALNVGLVAFSYAAKQFPHIIEYLGQTIDTIHRYEPQIKELVNWVFGVIAAAAVTQWALFKANAYVRLGTMIAGLALLVFQYKDEIVGTIKKVIGGLAIILYELLPLLVTIVTDVVDIVIYSLVDAIVARGPDILKGIGKLLESILGGIIILGLELGKKLFPSMSFEYDKWINKINEELGKDTFKDTEEQVQKSTEHLLKTIDDTTADANGALDELVNQFNLEDSKKEKFSLPNVVRQGADFFGNLGGNILGQNAGETVASWFSDYSDTVEEGGEEVTETIYTTADDINEAYEYALENNYLNNKGINDQLNTSLQSYLQSFINNRADAKKALEEYAATLSPETMSLEQEKKLRDLYTAYINSLYTKPSSQVIANAANYSNEVSDSMIQAAINYTPEHDNALSERMTRLLNSSFIAGARDAAQKANTSAELAEVSILPENVAENDAKKYADVFANTVWTETKNKLRKISGADQQVYQDKEIASETEKLQNELSARGYGPDGYKKVGTDSGEEYTIGVSEGIEKAKPTVGAKIIAFTAGMIDAIKSQHDDFKLSGENIMEGIVAGANPAVEGTLLGVRLATAIKNGFDYTLSIHSPSREFMKSAMYCVLGIRNGLNKYEYEATDASENVANNMVESFSNPFDRISDIASGKLKMSTNIQPIIDSNELTRQANGINSLVGASTIKLDGINSRITNDVADRVSEIDMNNSGVVSEIAGLRKDTVALGDAISKMQVVMDSRTVVGTLVGPMDTALGQRAIYRGRGN